MTIDQALQVLELSAPIEREQLKTAYREALMVWHPDRFEGNKNLQAKAQNRSCLINEAYSLLSSKSNKEHPFKSENETLQMPWDFGSSYDEETEQESEDEDCDAREHPKSGVRTEHTSDRSGSSKSPSTTSSSYERLTWQELVYGLGALVFLIGGLWLLLDGYAFKVSAIPTQAKLVGTPVYAGRAKFGGPKYSINYTFTANGREYAGKGRVSTLPYVRSSITIFYSKSDPGENRPALPDLAVGWASAIFGLVGLLAIWWPFRWLS